MNKRTVTAITSHAITQSLTMAIAFVTGIYIIRCLPKEEYAYYSVGVALTAALTLTAEAGISSVILGRGGRRQLNSLGFSYIIISAQKFRWIIAPPILIIGGIAVLYMLLSTGAPVFYGAILSVVAVFTAWTNISTGIYQNVQRLNYDFAQIRFIALSAAIFRLLLIYIIVGHVLQNALVAALISLFASIFIFSRHKVQAGKTIVPDGGKTVRYVPFFMRAARRTLPMSLLLIVSEQSVILILAANGATSSIAEVSALARFGIVFTLLNTIYSDMAAPYVARAEMTTKQILGRIGILSALHLLLASLGVGAFYLASSHVLGLLGPEYSHLNSAFMIILAGQALLNFGYALGFLVQARGWTKWSTSYALFIVIWAVAGMAYLNLANTQGAALFMASQSVPLVLTQVIRIFGGILGKQ